MTSQGVDVIAISGTRDTSHRPDEDFFGLFADYVRPFTRRPGIRLYVGGAVGVDALALRWLAHDTEAEITVVVPSTVARQPEPAQLAIRAAQEADRLREIVELEHPDFPSTEAYHARNRWMVDRSRLLIAFPLADGTSSGTRYTIGYASATAVSHLIVPV